MKKAKDLAPTEPFVMTDAIRLRTVAIDSVLRMGPQLPWRPANAEDFLKAAEEMELWLKRAK